MFCQKEIKNSRLAMDFLLKHIFSCIAAISHLTVIFITYTEGQGHTKKFFFAHMSSIKENNRAVSENAPLIVHKAFVA